MAVESFLQVELTVSADELSRKKRKYHNLVLSE